MWPKCVEASPGATQSVNDVAKALLIEIILRWGIPSKISSDISTHFANEAPNQIGKLLGIDLKNTVLITLPVVGRLSEKMTC